MSEKTEIEFVVQRRRPGERKWYDHSWHKSVRTALREIKLQLNVRKDQIQRGQLVSKYRIMRLEKSFVADSSGMVDEIKAKFAGRKR